jgi:uncharacterized protein YqjF (DUF2071 family)
MATFLQAEWRKLSMANYAVDPAILQHYIPVGTELDLWKGTCYVSLVGFMFVDTKVRGIKIPCHANFEEVNLRFYIRHKHRNEWRRGVVFIKEIVPRSMVTLVANNLYGEHYQTMPMQHRWQQQPGSIEVEYKWKLGRWNSLQVVGGADPRPLDVGSEAEFILEHYWGYTKLNERQTSEYKVEHPNWEIYPTRSYSVDVDFGNVYGNDFDFLSNEKPKSVFLAEGSEINVLSGRKIQ